MKRSTTILVGGILLATPARAQQLTRASEPRAQVLVLGTFHFDNPGLDVVKSEIADVLTPVKQAEIDEVLRGLARFNPTKIAVEVRAHRAPRLDSLYAAYRAGEHALGRSEVQQLGFRLAERFGHSQLHAIDHEGDFPFGSLMEYAQKHDPAVAERIQRAIAGITEERNRMHREETIGEILRQDNTPESVAWGHGMYVGLARVGAGDTYVGADLLAKWYERNIRIFSDVQRIAEPGDRILVIFGAGHAAILRDLVAGDPGLELVDAIDYLGAAQTGDTVSAPLDGILVRGAVLVVRGRDTTQTFVTLERVPDGYVVRDIASRTNVQVTDTLDLTGLFLHSANTFDQSAPTIGSYPMYVVRRGISPGSEAVGLIGAHQSPIWRRLEPSENHPPGPPDAHTGCYAVERGPWSDTSAAAVLRSATVRLRRRACHDP